MIWNRFWGIKHLKTTRTYEELINELNNAIAEEFNRQIVNFNNLPDSMHCLIDDKEKIDWKKEGF